MQFNSRLFDKIKNNSTTSAPSVKSKSKKVTAAAAADDNLLADVHHDVKSVKTVKAPKKAIKVKSVETDESQLDALMAGPEVEMRADPVYQPSSGVHVQTRPGAKVDAPELDLTFSEEQMGETVGADEDFVEDGFPWGWLLFGGLLAAGLAAYLIIDEEEEDPEESKFHGTEVLTDNVGVVTGVLVNGSITDDTVPTVSGSGETANSTVTVYIDGSKAGTAKVDANGKWTFEPSTPLTTGDHTFTTTIQEPGKTVSPKSPAVTITIDTTGPAPTDLSALDLQDNVGDVQGKIAVNATIAEVSAVEHTDDTTPTYSGDFTATDVASVKIFDNGVLVGTAPVDANGKWTFTPSTPLSEGNHIFTHQGVDKVGNAGDLSKPWAFIIDTTGPGASTNLDLKDDEGKVQGTVAKHETIAQVLASEYTDDATPTYSGKVAASDATQVIIFDKGVAVATVPVATDGSWTYTPKFPLENGNHIFTNQAVDAIGNFGALSTPWAFVLQTVGAAPAVPAITEVFDDKENKTGALQKNDYTNDETLVVSGTGAAGTTVTVFSNGDAVGTAAVDANGKWVLSSTRDLGADGLKNFTASAQNAQGLTSEKTGIYPVILDRTNPAASDNWTLNDNVGAVTGVISEGSTIDDSTPTLIGQLPTSEAGSTVSVYMDNKFIGTAVAGSDGKWTLSSTALADGKHAAQIKVTDAAGNTSALSTAKNFIIDSTGAVSVEYAVDNVQAHTGNVTDGGITNDKTPELVGKAPANATVTVTDPSGAKVTAVADANGVWKAQMGQQGDGVQNYKVSSISTAGVAGSATFSLNVDGTAPGKVTSLLVTDDVGSIQGTVIKNSTIDDATPTIQGEKAVSGDTVTVYNNGKIIGSTVVKADGTWSFTAPKPGLPEGSHDFQVTMTDPAGNTGDLSESYPFIIDTTPPGKPSGLDLQDNFGDKQGQVDKNATIAEVSETEYTDDKTPTYSGVSTGAATVVIYDKGVQIATVSADANGKWSYTPPSALTGSEHIFTSKGIDAAGNEGEVSDPWAFMIDAKGVAPAAPAITEVFDDKENLTGALQKNDHTNDETLVISGTGTPSTTVTVYSNGKDVGTAAVDANGKWNLPATKDLGEDGLKNLTAKATNAQGLVSPETGIYPVVLDRTNPAASNNWTINDNVGSITGVVSEGATIDDTTPTMVGQLPTAEAGSTVTVYMDNKVIGTAVAGSDGKWSLTSAALADGKHAAQIKVTDSAGNSSALSESKSFVINSEGAVSVEYAIDNVEAHLGNVTDGGVTNDRTPELVGKAPANSTVTVTDPAGNKVTAVANANGVWTAQMGQQPDGVQNYKVTSVTPAGVAGSASFKLNVDGTAPAKVSSLVVTDDVGTIQGVVVKNSTIDDVTPTIEGQKGQPGDTVTIFDKGVILGSTVVKTDGTWSFSAPKPGLLEGQHDFQVTMTDPAGNTSEKSDSYPFIIDVTPPGQPTGLDLQDNVGAKQGQIDKNATLAEVTEFEYTDDKTPTYSGVSAGAATVVIYDNGVKIATAPVDANGKWTYTPTADLLGAGHIFASKGIDAAGNESEISAPWAFVIGNDVVDPIEPVITQVLDDKENVTGALQKNGHTNDETLVISGTGEASTTITVFSNGKSVGTALVDATGNWKLNPTSDLGEDGLKNLTAQAINKQGLKSTETGIYPVILDRTNPTVGDDSWTVNDNVGTITGVVSEGAVIDDSTPTMIGALPTTEAGSTVSVYMDGQLIGTSVVGNDGKWSLTSATLANGEHAAQVKVTDLAGNTSALSAAKHFTLDSNGAVSVDYAVDNVEAHLGNVADGGVTNDKTPELVGKAPANSTVTVTDPAGNKVTAVADATGVWKAQMGQQPDGVQNYKVTSVSPSGVPGSATFSLNVDGTAPTKATPTVIDDVGTIQGVVVKNSTIDDILPTIQGESGQSGDTVTIYDNGQLIGTTTVSPNGKWSFTVPETAKLAEGQHDFQVTMTDPAGNTSAKSDSYPFVIDVTAPAKPTGLDLQDNVGDKKGQIDKNATIAEVSETERTDDTTPTYSGIATDATSVVIYDNGVQIATVPVGADGKWTYTPAVPLTGSNHIFTSKAVDAAGNQGAISDPWAFVIDVLGVAPAAPAITEVFDDKLNKTGALQKNDHTNDETLVVSGTGTPNTTVTVYSNGTAVGTAAVGSDGKWTLPSTADLGVDGLKNLTAKATSATGLQSPSTGIFPVVLDRTNPDASDNWTLNDNVGLITGVIAEGALIDDTTPSLIGQLPSAEAGSTVAVYMDNKLIGTTVAGSDGKWTLTSPALADGKHAAHIQVTDSSGNTSGMSKDKTFTINSDGAVSVEYAVDNVLAHTGNVTDGGVTNDKTPELVGKAPANSTVTVTDAKGAQVTAVADANGVWKAQMGEQPDGVQNYKVTSVSPSGVAGQTSFSLNVDATAPVVAAPIVTDDVGSIQGTVAKNSTIDDVTPTIQGEKGQAGDTVTVYDKGEIIGTTTVKTDGTWSFSAPKPGLLEGQHDFQVTMTDPAGNTSAKSESYPFIIDVTPPGKPTGLDLQDNVGDKQGQIDVNATIADVAPREYTDDKTPTYSGVSTGAATVAIYDNGVQIATVPVDANGKWIYTPANDLIGKNHIFTSKGIDAAGNEGQVSDPWAFVIDQVVTPPVTITDVIDDKPLQTGPLQKNGLTNDDTLLVQGKFGASTTGNEYIVYVYVDGVQVGTTKTDSQGNWSFTTPSLGADGVKVITASGYDPVADIKTGSTDPFPVVLDRTNPGANTMTLIDNVGDKTGAINNKDVTDDTTPTVNGQADPKDAGGTVTITLDGQTATAIIGADGKWTYTPTTPLAEGNHTVTSQVTDPAGNTAAALTPIDFTIDSSKAPVSINYARDDVPAHTENVADNGLTNDKTPVLVGSAKPLATVTITDEKGAVVTAVANAQGIWEAQMPNQTDGVHTYTANAKDASGNTTTSSAFHLNIDTVAPAAPTDLTIIDDVGSVKGVIAKNGSTDDITPTITGKGVPNDTISVYDNGQFIGTAAVDGTGTWALTPVSPGWVPGQHNVTTTATDPAGNTSEPSVPYPFTIDLTAPTTPTVKATDPDADNMPTATGTAEPNSTVTITWPDGSKSTTLADAKGDYSIESTTMQNSGTVTATSTDAAGNVSSPAVDKYVDVVPTPTIDVTDPDKDDFPTATGTAEPNSTVTITWPDGSTITTVASATGNYSVESLTTQNSGTVTATSTDALKNTSAPATDLYTDVTNPLPPTVKATDPDADDKPTATGTAEPNSKVTITWPDGTTITTTADAKGNYSIESETTQTSGTVTATSTDKAGNTSVPATDKYVDTTNPLPPTVKATDPDADDKPTATGTAEPNSKVTITWPDGTTITTTADAKGNYSIESETTQTSGTVTATSTDKAGNTSVPATDKYVDTTNPLPPTVKATDPDADDKPTATGTAEPNSKVTITWPDGTTITTTADAKGNYSIESETMQTSGTVTATSTDKAGNTSVPATDKYVDTTNPLPPTVKATDPDADDKPTATGTAEPNSKVTITWPDGTTITTTADAKGNYSIESETTQTSGTVTATSTDKAGNTSVPATDKYVDTTNPLPPTVKATDPDADDKPTATGTAEPNSKVTITWPDGSSISTTADAKGNYSIESLTKQVSGTVTATSTDKVGNTSAPATDKYVDLTGPTVTVAADDLDKDDLPTATGVVNEANAKVIVTWPDGSSISTTSGADGSYSVEALTPQTTGTVYAVAVDQAGNSSAKANASYVDRTVPGRPGTLDMTDATDTGVSSTDNATKDTTPTYAIVGGIKAGDTPRLYIDGVFVDSVFDPVKQTLTPVLPVAKGSHNVQLAFADQAGNVSPLSQSNLTKIYEDPTITISKPVAGDGVISANEAAGTIRGTTVDIEEGQSVVLTFKDAANHVVTATTTVDGTGAWIAPAVNLSTLTDGQITLTASTTDRIKNPASETTTVNLDLVATRALLASDTPIDDVADSTVSPTDSALDGLFDLDGLFATDSNLFGNAQTDVATGVVNTVVNSPTNSIVEPITIVTVEQAQIIETDLTSFISTPLI